MLAVNDMMRRLWEYLQVNWRMIVIYLLVGMLISAWQRLGYF